MTKRERKMNACTLRERESERERERRRELERTRGREGGREAGRERKRERERGRDFCAPCDRERRGDCGSQGRLEAESGFFRVRAACAPTEPRSRRLPSAFFALISHSKMHLRKRKSALIEYFVFLRYF
jgi:hypothetical protein